MSEDSSKERTDNRIEASAQEQPQAPGSAQGDHLGSLLLQQLALPAQARPVGPKAPGLITESTQLSQARMHLEGCSSCQSELAALGRLGAALSDLPLADPGPDFSAAVLASIERSAAPASERSSLEGLGGLAGGLLFALLAWGGAAVYGLELGDGVALLGRAAGELGGALVWTLSLFGSVLGGAWRALPEGTGTLVLVLELGFFVALLHIGQRAGLLRGLDLLNEELNS